MSDTNETHGDEKPAKKTRSDLEKRSSVAAGLAAIPVTVRHTTAHAPGGSPARSPFAGTRS